MIFKKVRFIVAGLGASCALAMLSVPAAEAAPYIACMAAGSQSTGLFTYNHEIYSLECQGEGMGVVAQARSNSDNTGIQVRLRSATNTSSRNAYAFGYNMSQQLIPGCIAHDTTAGTSWTTDDCNASGDDFVKFLGIVVNAE